MQVLGALGFAAVVAAALAVGPAAVGVVAVVAATVALLDAALLLGKTGAKPVLPIAAIPGIVLPLLAALDAGDPAGWGRIGELFAVAVVGGFALLIVFGRRRGAVVGLGATFAAGLIVGLGAASLVLLHDLPEGFRWVLALVVLVAVADLASAAAGAWQQRRSTADGEAPAPGVAPLLATLAAVALAAATLAFLLDPPVTPRVVAVLGATAAVAALGGDHLNRAFATEAEVADRPTGLGGGAILGAVDALLLAAPVAYVLARGAVL